MCTSFLVFWVVDIGVSCIIVLDAVSCLFWYWCGIGVDGVLRWIFCEVVFGMKNMLEIKEVARFLGENMME